MFTRPVVMTAPVYFAPGAMCNTVERPSEQVLAGWEETVGATRIRARA